MLELVFSDCGFAAKITGPHKVDTATIPLLKMLLLLLTATSAGDGNLAISLLLGSPAVMSVPWVYHLAIDADSPSKTPPYSQCFLTGHMTAYSQNTPLVMADFTP
eukprot:scpid112385/ scgid16611/ 